MLVVIPTYKRNECLRWVLQSLIQCHVDKIPDQVRVLVVNNYPPAADEIERIVNEFAQYKQFVWDILYRKKTLLPVENWFSAIFEWAHDDEVVVFNADDDLLLPLSLEVRYLEIIKSRADMLLAQAGPNIFFSKGGEKIFCCDTLKHANHSNSVLLDFGTVQNYAPQHLSNHCYKNTVAFRHAYEKAMAWCDEMQWLDYNNRTIFLPLFLPFALMLDGRDVSGLSEQVFLRGRDVDEIRKSPFGIPSWNHGFIHSVALSVMGNSALKNIAELDNLRRNYLHEYIRWFPTYFFDPRLQWRNVILAKNMAGITWAQLLSPKLFFGIKLVIKELAGLRGIDLERRARRDSVAGEEFLERIAIVYASI
jgi:hypothetical protein